MSVLCGLLFTGKTLGENSPKNFSVDADTSGKVEWIINRMGYQFILQSKH